MADATIVTDLHSSLDELFARADLATMEPESLGWPQAKLILGAAIALDASGRAARRILISDTYVDLRLVAEVVLIHSHEGFCQGGSVPAYKCRWELATVVVHYCRAPTEENHRAVMAAFFDCAAVLLDVMPYVKSLAEAVDAKRKEQP